MEVTTETYVAFTNITEPYLFLNITTLLINVTEGLFINGTEGLPIDNITEPYHFLNITTDPTKGTYNSHNITEPYLFWNTTTDPSNGTHNGTNKARDFSKFFPILIAEMLLSCLCLIFSIAVYSILPEFRNVHGKNLISMSVCLLIAYGMLIFDLLMRKVVSRAVCFNTAVVIHVTFLGYFSWTNVMAFDIWKSLTDMKAKGVVKGSSKKFLKYSIYAWTATLLTATLAAVLDLVDWVPVHYRPQFGVKRCWLNGRTAFYIYFNLPVGVVLLCNLCMFLLTLRKLVIIKRMTAVLNVKQQQKRLNLYMKLFLVMGITWTTEFLPWLTGIRFLYAIAGMMTALHGIVLFAIFVCKKKTLVNFYHALQSKRNAKTSTVFYSTSQQTVSTSSNKKCSVAKLSDSQF